MWAYGCISRALGGAGAVTSPRRPQNCKNNENITFQNSGTKSTKTDVKVMLLLSVFGT